MAAFQGTASRICSKQHAASLCSSYRAFSAGVSYMCVCILLLYCDHDRAIGLLSRVFAKYLGDRGSISCRVIPKIKKWYLMPACLTLSIIR